MRLLTKRDLITYAFVGQGVHGVDDYFEGLLPFFQPIIEEMGGKIFDPHVFAREVRQKYGWPVNTDVVQELIPRLERVKWIERVSHSKDSAAYICKEYAKPIINEAEEKELDNILREIGEKLRTFSSTISPLFSFGYSAEQFEEMLLNWIVQVAGYDKETIVRAAKDNNSDSDVFQHIPDTLFSSQEEGYLCARFVADLQVKSPDLFERLVQISAVALLTEVVLDFQRPPQVGRKEKNLTVLLDAPVLMDLLGLSGRARNQNAEYIVEGLRRLESKIGAFKHSCDEVRDNLSGLFRKSPQDRFGPTADAIRNGETVQAYASSVMQDPEHYVKEKLRIDLIAQDLNLFPNQHGYFSRGLYEELRDRINWHEESVPKERDAKSVAFIMRRRGGKQSVDPLKSGFLLITRSNILAEFSKRYCIEQGLIKNYETGPVIHQRRLAALIWLTFGTNEKEVLSRRQLLAACESVVRSRPQIIEKAQNTLKSIRPQDLDQLNALLTKPRST